MYMYNVDDVYMYLFRSQNQTEVSSEVDFHTVTACQDSRLGGWGWGVRGGRGVGEGGGNRYSKAIGAS